MNISKTHNHLRKTHTIGKNTAERIVTANQASVMREFGIFMMGISQAKNGFKFVRDDHNVFQILACLSGHGQVLIDEDWQTCSPNHAYLTPVDILHAYHAPKRGKWDVCWVMYEQTPWLDLLPIYKPQLIELQVQPIHAAISCLHHEVIGANDSVIIRQWVGLIDQLIQRACVANQKPSRLWQLWQAVDMNLVSKWNNDRLAELADLSTEHLRRLCQAELGHAPMQQVTELRMQRAGILLSTTDMLIEQIAHAVGYDNAFAFTTAFKRQNGMSPTAYRATAR
ncbi:MAG: AraC family transcriptional regulator [Phycisphaeraceae bacterium JB051]